MTSQVTRKLRKDVTRMLKTLNEMKLNPGNPKEKEVLEEAREKAQIFALQMLDVVLPQMEKMMRSPEVVIGAFLDPITTEAQKVEKEQKRLVRYVALENWDEIRKVLIAFMATSFTIALIVDLIQTKVMGSGLELRVTNRLLFACLPAVPMILALFDTWMRNAFMSHLDRTLKAIFAPSVPTEYQITKFYYEGHINASRAWDWFKWRGFTKEFSKTWLAIVEREPTRAECERFVRWGLTEFPERPEDPRTAPKTVSARKLVDEARIDFDAIFGDGALNKAMEVATKYMERMRLGHGRAYQYLATMWRIPSPFYMRYIMETPIGYEAFPVNVATKWFIRHGYHPKIARVLARAMKYMIIKDEVRMLATEVMRWRGQGYWSEDTMVKALEGLELTPPEIDLRKTFGSMRYQREILEWKVRTWVTQYRENVITDNELFDKLVGAGIDSIIANWMVNYERARRGMPEKEFAS